MIYMCYSSKTKGCLALNQTWMYRIYLGERTDQHIGAPLRDLAQLQCDKSIANCQTVGIDTKSNSTVGERKSIVTNNQLQNLEKSQTRLAIATLSLDFIPVCIRPIPNRKIQSYVIGQLIVQ